MNRHKKKSFEKQNSIIKKSSDKPKTQNLPEENSQTLGPAEDILVVAPLNKNTVSVKILNERTNALVDTGASISCISLSFVKKCGIDLQTIEPCDVKQVAGVGGDRVSVIGKTLIPIVIAGARFDFKFHVLDDFHHKLIIGVDFLYENKCFVDLGQGMLYVKEGLISARLTVQSGSAKVTKPVCIPAREETELPVSISRTFKNEIILLEPVPTNKDIRVARCLVKAKQSKGSKSKTFSALVRVLNPTDDDIYLPANFTVASASRVDTENIFAFNENCASQECAHVNVVSDKNENSNLVFNISNPYLTSEQCSQLKQFLHKNSDIFSGSLDTIGKTSVFTHKIETETDAKPVHMNYYRQGPVQKAEIEKKTKEMLNAGIVSPSDSVWHSPVVLVKKKDGTYRFAIDYRNLNKITKAISHPLPRLEDVFDCLGESSATIFSTLDLNSAYFQMELDPETKHKSAFITHEGVYVFNRMPFGLKNAPMSFQMLMSQVLRGLHWKIVLCYIDDLLVFSRTFDEHLSHLDQVFKKLREANLTLKPEKCHFGLEKVMFLGHILSKDGISVDPAKIEKVKNFPVPRSQTELKSFLGLCNYYRRFVSGFANIASPLNSLLKGNKKRKFQKGEWTDECQSSFQKLKDALTTAPILGFPDMNKDFILSTDASGTAVGYVLGQKDNQGREYVIAYGGRALSKDEKKWSVFDQECLGVIEGIKTFRHYLSHRKFTVFTDHKALSYLYGLKDPKGRLARWCMFLEGYSFDIIHKPGRQNANADAISRIPYPQDTCDTSDANVVQSVTTLGPKPDSSTSLDSGSSSPLSSDSEYYDSDCSDQEANTVTVNTVNCSQTCLNHKPPSGNMSARGMPVFQSWFAKFLMFIFWLQNVYATVYSVLTVSDILDFDNNFDHNDVCLVEAVLEYGNSASVCVVDKADSLTDADMAALQRKCSDFDFLIEYLETRMMPIDEKKQRICLRAEEQFVLKDGLLYHYYQPKHKGRVDLTNHYVFQLAAPREIRKDLLYHYHDNLAGGGHFGVTRTFEKLRQKYWFPKMLQEIKDYVSSCDSCQRSKTDRKQRPPPLHPLPVEDTMSRVHIDILGPLPKTKQGHQYILLIIDSFSKWPEAFPLVSQSAQEIASVLYNEYICRYGAPRALVSDRGKNFMSKLVSALCELFHIKRYHTSSYHPQSNAAVERANSTLAKNLTAYVQDDQMNWSTLLPSIMMASRSTPSTESSGFSPYHLVFGKEMTLPVDVGLLPKPSMPAHAKQFLDSLLGQLKIAKDIAKQNMELAKKKSKERYDKKAEQPDFQVNDKVLLRRNAVKPGLSAKLSRKWVGPYMITSVGPRCTYKIKDCNTNKVLKTLVNASRLKHYQEPLHSDNTGQNTSDDEKSKSDPQPEHNSVTSSSEQLNGHSHARSNTPQPVETSGPQSPLTSKTVVTKSPQAETQSVENQGRNSDSHLGPQIDESGTESPLIKPDRIVNVSRYKGERWFRCFVAGRKKSEWIVERLIDPTCLQVYLQTHTTSGKRRKRRQKPMTFWRRRDPEE